MAASAGDAAMRQPVRVLFCFELLLASFGAQVPPGRMVLGERVRAVHTQQTRCWGKQAKTCSIHPAQYVMEVSVTCSAGMRQARLQKATTLQQQAHTQLQQYTQRAINAPDVRQLLLNDTHEGCEHRLLATLHKVDAIRRQQLLLPPCCALE
jgi:hypothetical protein